MTDFDHRRMLMVDHQLAARDIHDQRVLDVFGSVPRHRFVPQADRDRAYSDHPLPVGHGQTISQPYMVALMTQYLHLRGGEKVLEIGTGSGYQTGILAQLAGSIYTIERIAQLSESARKTLDELGYGDIHFKIGDGTLGWPEEAPFDRILVTAGAPHVPRPLTDQLADGGRLVIPVGSRSSQILQIVCRHGDRLRTIDGCMCVFVKLIGQEGWQADE